MTHYEVCCHEAAHAVVALAVGLGVRQVSAIPKGYRCLHNGDADRLSRRALAFKQVTMLFAGGYGSVRAGGPAGDEVDRQGIASIAGHYGFTDDDLSVAEARARAIIDQHWLWVERIARELQVRKHLNEADCMRLRPR